MLKRKTKKTNKEKYTVMSLERVCAYINLDNALKNMENFKSIVSENTKIMAVIKADGYGHGAVRIAKKLKDLPYLAGFAVATAEEAFELRDSGIDNTILILGYTFKEDYEKLIENDIRVAVFTDEMIDDLSIAAGKLGKNAYVHVKLDTGMSRIGIQADADGVAFVRYAEEKDNINVEGLFTHLARADEYDKTKADNQIKLYNDFVEMLLKEGIDIPVKHVSNSASILELSHANMDMVRAGITLYGLWPSNEVSKEIIPLYPMMKLVSHVSFVKTLEAGREISYGGTYKVNETKRIATVPCGYADGIPRGLSNKGCVLIHGKKAPITGRVCMDQFMIDVSDIDDVRVGDEVVIIGEQNGTVITAEEVGDISGRFNYELVCDISKRVPRVYE